MTKLKIQINKKEKIIDSKKEGAYLATFTNEDDRILFIDGCGDLKAVISIGSYDNEFYIQVKQNIQNYTNLKKIKKIAMEIELA